MLTDWFLKEKAEKIAVDYKIEDFKASSGWYEKFKNRDGLKCRKICGISFSAPPNDHSQFLTILRKRSLHTDTKTSITWTKLVYFTRPFRAKRRVKNLEKDIKILRTGYL